VAVAVALLATFTLLDRNRSTCAVTAATVYGGEPTAYSENSAETNYDGDDEGDGEYDGGGRDGTEEREDQLDQDDPGISVPDIVIINVVYRFRTICQRFMYINVFFGPKKLLF